MVTIKRTYSGVDMISTSRHPACLMASAVRQISAFVMRTSFMCKNFVGPICPALKQFADETANLPAHRFRPPLVRLPGFSGVGFLFILFSQAFKDRDFILLRADALRKIAIIRRAKQGALRR